MVEILQIILQLEKQIKNRTLESLLFEEQIEKKDNRRTRRK